MGNFLGKDALLAKEKLGVERIEFENGDYCFVREMTGHERDSFENSMLKKNKDTKGNVVSYETILEDFRSKISAITLCEEDGTPLMEPKDYVLLGKNMGAKRLDRIASVAQKLNAITEADKEALVKNLGVGQADNSNSAFVEN